MAATLLPGNMKQHHRVSTFIQCCGRWRANTENVQRPKFDVCGSAQDSNKTQHTQKKFLVELKQQNRDKKKTSGIIAIDSRAKCKPGDCRTENQDQKVNTEMTVLTHCCLFALPAVRGPMLALSLSHTLSHTHAHTQSPVHL